MSAPAVRLQPTTHSDNSAARPHLGQFDLLRGAAIIAVVYLHAYFTPWPEVSNGGLTAMRAAHLVAHGAVPLFLFIAAYLQASAPPEGVLEHLRRRLWTIWVPALAWMAATLVYRALSGDSPSTLARDLLLFDSSGQFYFIWLLLFFGVALTQAGRISGRWLPALVAAAFVVNLGAIGFYELQDTIDGTFATLAYRNPLAWVFFPVLGYTLGRGGIAVVRGRTFVAAFVGMLIAATCYMVPGLTAGYWPASYFGLSVFLFSACAMAVYPVIGSRLLSHAHVARPLTALSRYAFPIYLVHLPFVMGFGTRELLGEGANWSSYWLLLHTNAAVGFFVSLALVREVDKASPRLAAALLGVRRPRRRHPPKAPPTSGPSSPPRAEAKSFR